jgi:hypothetical protein
MDFAAKLGMAATILLLLTALVLFHVFFLPPRPRDDPREPPDAR